jgi:2-polyprenyl-3-methyl-5-hydroxy-6-metoxy-1,4-benzoquinol methylase
MRKYPKRKVYLRRVIFLHTEKANFNQEEDLSMEYYNQNKTYYDRNVHRYEAASWYYFNKYKNNAVLGELKKCVTLLSGKSAIRVLEIGPGTGYLLGKLLSVSKSEITYTGIEHSSAMSELITDRYAKSCKGFKIINDTVTAGQLKKDFYTDKYDLVMGSSILHHLPDYPDIVKGLSELVASGGVMYFVREPIYRDECKPGNFLSDTLEKVYHSINGLLMSPSIRSRLWPNKVKAEDSSKITSPELDEGVSTQVFDDLLRTNFRLVFMRKYNRRVSWIMSYVENKWLAALRKDVFGNTLFSIGLQLMNDQEK